METEPLEPGLYIVAGPIGNLGDLTPRAADILRRADVVAVEDTRVSARLLRHAGSDRPMLPYHDHSGGNVRQRLIERMAGESVALLSDAGTPLISDPGYKLVRDARAAGAWRREGGGREARARTVAASIVAPPSSSSRATSSVP